MNHSLEGALPRKIAIATDFSIASGLAIGWGITWAKSCGAQLHIVHVIEPSEYQGPAELRNLVRKEVHEEAERQLACYVGRLRDIPHTFVCLEGDIAATLGAFVEANDIDLLVTGSRGRRGVRRVMLGSTAEAIFHEVKCPVMTVGIDSANYTRPADGIHRILFPTDFSPDSVSALSYAVNLANAQDAQLLVLHVASESEPQEPEQPAPSTHHLEAMERMLKEVPPLNKPAKVICATGHPAEAILAAARDNVIDLLVLGIRNQKRLELDGAKPSLSYEIVARAQCPAITLHRFREEKRTRIHLAEVTQEQMTRFVN